MDRNGHRDVTEVPFRPSVGAPPGAAVLDFPGLAARARSHGLDVHAPMRLAFHQLITVRSGTLRCSVDFTEHELTEGGWMWVRPGQIHQFRSALGAADGAAVLFPSGYLGAATAAVARLDRPVSRSPLVVPEGAATAAVARLDRPVSRSPLVVPEGADAEAVRGVLGLLESEYRTVAGPLEAHVEVVRHLVAVLVLRLAHLPGAQSGDTAGSEAFRRFQQAVERDYTRTHRVEDYADRLGYSVRTLTRATRATVGCGAKRFIDDRVLLEAKRLLVHTGLSATAIGERLGFPDATVFTKFFRRRSGETPAGFRIRASGARR
ncbi:AraC family transcriptional regulator [Streptomyces rapamycinicus]|uniref:Translation initiation factor IF-2 n=2 Tax=Streptomyces rapamycinicus TaxID=1226757 RepID=A0A0A0NTR0_STRRN|nr:AraC family transcriptional regulator [Streptomyces rapamycinicus]AGP60891.1 translation initiation factor IF-2 [Streptomyces rapamycinicus NRRL 5491]MBB4787935.1 AraC-like DNA-binding protein [Streptomyces rapamycinicus]RLV72274.1 translation initiation factor IF-2 [Streptomyces rapamycinicus NRRL 5491]UTP36428.1 AraC family transcriptional regulator [Streptomyces rapamycinicus NRRL 5491]